ncbi:MAG: AMP-binding protein [Acholeplasmataceae bacterium]
MRKLKKILNERIDLLKQSNQTFEDIFKCINHQEENTFSEELVGYKINKTTYKEAKEASILMAHYFHDQITLDKGSYVGLMMENRKEWVFSFWGLLMAGYKPVLFNTRLGVVLNTEVVNLLEVKTIVTDTNVGISSHELNIEGVNLEKYHGKPFDFMWENEIAITSSATSLNIKVCFYRGENISRQILNTHGIIAQNTIIMKHYNNELKQLAFLPFYHVFGLIATYFWFTFFSRTFIFLKDYSTDTILNTIKRHKVTHIFAVPLLWHGVYKEIMKQVNHMGEKTKKKFNRAIKFSLFVQNIFPKLGLRLAKRMFKDVHKKLFGDSVFFLITGGSYINPEALRVINGIGYPLFNGYGMSEIGITSVDLSKRVKRRINGSIGQPFDSVEYRVEDDILYVRGTSLANFTVSNQGREEIKPDEWFNTQDIAHKENNQYYLNGRKDDVVISINGEKNNPDIIEKELFFENVNRFSVIGLKENNNYYLSLIVELSEGVHNIVLKKIIDEIEANLTKLKKQKYHIERVYVTYDPIAPASAVKVGRTILKKLIDHGKVELIPLHEIKSRESLSTESIENNIILEIVELISEILQKDQQEISLDSHFILDLGGTSLEYLTLLMKLNEIYHIDFDYINIGNLDTPRKFSDFVLQNIKESND